VVVVVVTALVVVVDVVKRRDTSRVDVMVFVMVFFGRQHHAFESTFPHGGHKCIGATCKGNSARFANVDFTSIDLVERVFVIHRVTIMVRSGAQQHIDGCVHPGQHVGATLAPIDAMKVKMSKQNSFMSSIAMFGGMKQRFYESDGIFEDVRQCAILCGPGAVAFA